MGKKFAEKQRRKKQQQADREQKQIRELKKAIDESTLFGPNCAEPRSHNKIPDYTANRRITKQYPSAAMPSPCNQISPQELEDEVMAYREKLAQEEIERRKKRTAPLYNKGGYQYITDDEDLTTIGKKV